MEQDLDCQMQHFLDILVNESVQGLLIIMRYCLVEIHFSHEAPQPFLHRSFFEGATLASSTVRYVLVEVSA